MRTRTLVRCFPAFGCTGSLNALLVYRPKLERRLTTLEKRLKVPDEERHVCEAKLEKATVVEIVGTRVYHRDQSLKLDSFGRNVNKSAKSSAKTASSATAAQKSLLADWVQPAAVPPEKHPPEVRLTFQPVKVLLRLHTSTGSAKVDWQVYLGGSRWRGSHSGDAGPPALREQRLQGVRCA